MGCLTFAYNVHKFSHNFHDPHGADEPATMPQAQSTAEGRMARLRQSTQTYLKLLAQKHYVNMISKFKQIFENQLQGFLRQIQQESSTRYEHFLSNLATRLDYNDYYSSVLAGVGGGGLPPGAAVPPPE